MDCAQPDRATARDLPLPQPQLEPQPQNFLDPPHGQSPRRHPVSPSEWSFNAGLLSSAAACLAVRLWKTFRSKPNAIPVGDKNCSPSHRNGVRLQTETVFTFDRIPQQSDKQPSSAEELQSRGRKTDLMLSRKRVLQQLERSSSERCSELLRRMLAALNAQIATLP
jgi:hypothetical protein